MKENFANMYNGPASKTAGEYRSFYTKISGFAQIVFYWDLQLQQEKKPPVWRITKDPISNMRIIKFDGNSFTVKLNNIELTFNKVDDDSFVMSEDSVKIAKNITWLEQEIIITQSTKNEAPREVKEIVRPKTWGQRRLEKIKAGDLFK